MARPLTLGSAGEHALIAGIASRAAAGPPFRALAIGIGDDCAVLRPPPGREIVVTTDLFLERVHFRRDWHSPESAGHRCLARGLSDLAAMGADPLAAFLSLALPAHLRGAWVRRFLDGLFALAQRAGVPLAGGDTAAAPAAAGAAALFSADIVLMGTVPTDKALLRSGALPGDRIYVTGSLGGAAAELAQLAAGRSHALRRLCRPGAASHPQLFPGPRLAQGRRLRRLATAALDLSDGLSTDLTHLCRASGVSAEIEIDRLPIHPMALNTEDPLARALHGGEDYELLFTARPETRIPTSLAGVPVTWIGVVRPRPRRGAPVHLLDSRGRRTALPAGGWEHFRSAAGFHGSTR